MLSRKSQDDHSLLCLDIGTASVKACVFQDRDEHLELKGFSRVQQQHGNLQGGAIVNISQTITNVQQVAKKAENMVKHAPRDMVVGLSGEFVRGTTLTLQYLRGKPDTIITAQEFKTILHELQWQAFDTIRRQISDEMSLSEIELKLLNASVVAIRLDGEAVTDPRGSQGTKVEMEIFNCFAPLDQFGQIQNIAVELPYHELKGVFTQSFAICHSLALRNALASALVLDIGAGVTDLCLIVDGKIVGNRSFAMGGNSLTKRIAYTLSTSFEEAESLKLSYSKDELEKKSHNIIQDALQSDLDIWISSLEFSLKELPIKKMPNTILLCGRASVMREFTNVLQEHDWEHHFPLNGEVEVRALEYSDILTGDFETEDLDQEYLPVVALANASYDLLYNNTSVESILNTIISDKGL
ncbi:MAG: cell division FtsA domain-containing protein [bacterium]|nr:cell division FtsA domain-containing protein [bacterium]